MSRGDHIYVGQVGSTRHGIDVGDGRVIHLSGEPGMSKVDASVRYATLLEFVRGGEVRVWDHGESYGPDEVVARAESKLGEGDHDVFGRHGEHFASWCVSDRNVSAPINPSAAAGGLGVMAAAATATGGGAVADVAALGAEAGLAGAGTGVDVPGGGRSLRREWSRAFSIMVVLLLAAAAATVVGIPSGHSAARVRQDKPNS